MDQPLINGHRYDFSSVELKVRGKTFTGITDISYSKELDRTHVYGTHSEPLGRTRGQMSLEASMTMYKEDYYELLEALGAGYMEVPFDVSVTYADNGERVKTDQILGCMINGEDQSHSSGNEGLAVEVTLSPMKIKLDGKEALKRPLRGNNSTFNPNPSRGR